MKVVIASDIHGAADYCQKLMQVIEEEQPKYVLLLGDLLYHGPRNDIPADYDPKRVIEMLNSISDKVIAVRGNCESEVDQSVLNFPCMADYNILFDKNSETGKQFTIFFTHGHMFGPGVHNSVDKWPQMPSLDAFVYGHTHRKFNEKSYDHPEVTVFNPGSVGIPKDGTHSCGIYENGELRHVILGE